MRNRVSEALAVAVVLGGLYLAYTLSQPADGCKDGQCPVPMQPNVQPGPQPARPDPKPDKPRRPWADSCGAPVGADTKGRLIADDTPAVDLLAMPSSTRPRNVGGRDGAGLCVFTSIQYAAWWQNEPRLQKFQQQMRQEPGGGYPSKVDKMIARYGPGSRYVQYEGNDPSIIELALRTGRVPCITWNGNHMLCCVGLDQNEGLILDNNAPDRVSRYSRSEFLRRFRAGGGGWVFVLLNPAPPPPPRGPARPQGEEPIPSGGVQNVYKWQQSPIKPGAWSLWDERGNQVGFWDGTDYFPLRGGRFGQPCEPPVELPNARRAYYGVEQWFRRDNVYSINGNDVSRERALAALAEDSLADDSTLAHLTVIGPDADRQRVLADLESNPALAGWKGRLRVQSYAPQDWAVSSFGFVTAGAPTIYLQGIDGKPLFRVDNYAGPVALAQAIAEGLRRPDPSYDPAKDPRPGGSSVKIPEQLRGTALPLLGIALFALFVFLRGGKSDV